MTICKPIENINPNLFSSDNEVDIELTRDEAVVIKKVGVRSFGIGQSTTSQESRGVMRTVSYLQMTFSTTPTASLRM